MGVRESVVGRRSELAWSPTGEASQCKRDGDAAIGLTLSPHATQLVVVAPPPATPAPASAPCPSERCVAFTLRHRRRATDTTTLGLQNRFAVGRPSPRRRCRRRMGAAEQSRAEQASLRFYASQLQASARIGSHPTHILPARRQQLIIITRFLTKTKKRKENAPTPSPVDR